MFDMVIISLMVASIMYSYYHTTLLFFLKPLLIRTPNYLIVTVVSCVSTLLYVYIPMLAPLFYAIAIAYLVLLIVVIINGMRLKYAK